MKKPSGIAVIGIAATVTVASLTAWLLVIGERRRDTAAADTVVVHAGRVPTSVAAAATTPAPGPAASLPAAVAVRIGEALRLPAGYAINAATTSPVDTTAICGRVSTGIGRAERRFVYAGEAGLAALDDGGGEFAALWDHFCPR